MPRLRADIGRAVVLGVALLASATLAACSEAPESESDRPSVTVFGPWRGVSADAFRASMTTFEERSGIDVVYTGSARFVDDATKRVEDGLAADVMIFPQPGLMLELADLGLLLPLPSQVVDTAERSHRPEVTEALSSVRADVGVVYRLNVKSLVWYPPVVFDAFDYSVPRSWTELDALAQQIADDGTAPWCLGVEAFSSSGWAATDWVEDIVLRSAPPQTYDRWVAGDLPFTDPTIASSFEDFSDMALAPGRSLGGRRAVLNTNVAAAAQPQFDDPSGCVLHRQASFAADDLDPSVVIGPGGDTDVFILPSRDGEAPPLLVGGTFAAAGTDRPETWELLAYLASAEGSAAWVERGGFISPHASVTTDDYGTAFDARMAQLLADADVVRFDGSDLMPPAVGTGTFYSAMQSYIATDRLDDALAEAQRGYNE
ncbi:MAG: extracellular solute-binding protein [Jiangellales bacterium]